MFSANNHSSILTSQELANETVVLKRLFLSIVLTDNEYETWLATQDTQTVKTQLTDAEQKTLLVFTARLKQIIFPNGWVNQKIIDSKIRNAKLLDQDLQKMQREIDTDLYDQKAKQLEEMYEDIKNAEAKFHKFKRYQEALLGGTPLEDEPEILSQGIKDDSTALFKKLLDEESALNTLLAEEIINLYEIANKFHHYVKSQTEDQDVHEEDNNLPTHPRRHPLFPTVAEAKKDKTLVLSDHLAVLTTVPLKKKNTSIKILSLNVLGPYALSGFDDQETWENDIEARIRYKKIIDGLILAVNKHGVDVIALQETTPKFIVPILKARLNALGWNMIVDPVGIITCYNANKYNYTITSLDHVQRIRSLTLQNKQSKECVEIHNIWGWYNAIPYRFESIFKKLLSGIKNITSIIIGDTNSRIAPFDDRQRNIATGIVPLTLNAQNGAQPNEQMTDHPDGGFYSTGKGSKIHQLETQIIDLTTGEIIKDQRPPSELNSWPEFRMILCLDNRYEKLKVIDQYSIVEYEQRLNKLLGGEKVAVRMAATSINQKAIAIQFDPDSNLYKYLYSMFNDKHQFQIRLVENSDEKEKPKYPVIFAPKAKAMLLHQAIENYYLQNNLKSMASLLENKNGLFAKNNKREATELNGFLASLSNHHTFAEQKKYILQELQVMKDNHKGIIAFSNTKKYKLIKNILRNMDRPELRNLRDYAYELGTFIGDEKALTKAKKLHFLLNSLYEETNPEIVIQKLLNMRNNSNIFSEHRHIFHIGSTKTVNLINNAIRDLQHTIHRNNELVTHQFK